MPFLPPDVRISRHVEKLLGYAAESKVAEVLDRCGLARDGSLVYARDGFVTDESCYQYKQALKADRNRVV